MISNKFRVVQTTEGYFHVEEYGPLFFNLFPAWRQYGCQFWDTEVAAVQYATCLIRLRHLKENGPIVIPVQDSIGPVTEKDTKALVTATPGIGSAPV